MTNFTNWAARAYSWSCTPVAMGFVITCKAIRDGRITAIPATVTNTHIAREQIQGIATATAILALRAAMTKKLLADIY